MRLRASERALFPSSKSLLACCCLLLLCTVHNTASAASASGYVQSTEEDVYDTDISAEGLVALKSLLTATASTLHHDVTLLFCSKG